MLWGFPGGSNNKESTCNVGDLGLIPDSGRSPREGNGYPHQYLAWRTPWTEEPGGLHSPWGHKESDMTEQLTLFHFIMYNGSFTVEAMHYSL